MRLFRALFLVSLSAYASCSLFGPPTESTIYLQSGTTLNPNPDGKSTPVPIRIYQLKDHQSFVNADFAALWDDDTKVLGASLAGPRQESALDVGSSKQIELQVMSGTKFVALMGLFNKEAEGKAWQQIVPLGEADDYLFYFENDTIARRER